MPSTPHPTSADQPGNQPPRVSPDNMLPPVEPPSATFILQLFLIPLLIVGIIVVVWLGVSYLAHKSTSPLDLIDQMEKGRAGAWQAATNLSTMLRDPKYTEIKKDPEVMQRLSNLLNKQIDAKIVGGTKESDKVAAQAGQLRFFMCHALAQFHLPDASASLVKAAKEDIRPEVREGAIESLAILASNVSGPKLRTQPDVVPALIDASRERGEKPADGSAIRQRAAFALGVIGGPEATEQLAKLLSDPHADVRFNAATGLAREGDARALPVLARMIDPDNKEAISVEADDKTHKFKQMNTMYSAIEAVKIFHGKNPQADFGDIQKSLEKAIETGPGGQITVAAKELRMMLEKK